MSLYVAEQVTGWLGTVLWCVHGSSSAAELEEAGMELGRVFCDGAIEGPPRGPILGRERSADVREIFFLARHQSAGVFNSSPKYG